METTMDFPRATGAPQGMQELHCDPNRPGIAMEGNVVYAARDGLALRLQMLYPLYEKYADPRGQRHDFPCVLHIHGSGWRQQDVYRRIPCLVELAKRGYVIASVEYRPSSVAGFPAQVLDAKTGLRYLRQHAAKYNGDPARIAVMGDSSGGHTSLLVNLTAGVEGFLPNLYPEVPDTVCGCIDLYGPVGLASMANDPTMPDHTAADSPEGLLMGGRALKDVPEEELVRTDPVHWLDPRRPAAPTLIVHGDMDRVVPFAQSVRLYEAMRDAGEDVAFYKLRDGGHGGPEYWTPQMIDLYDSFLRRCFGVETKLEQA